MRERAALHGGRLTVGPVAGGGFWVRVWLPLVRCEHQGPAGRRPADASGGVSDDPRIRARHEVVSEAENGDQAVAAIRRLRPRGVQMDVQMPVEDGLHATRWITGSSVLPSRVLILTTFERDEYVFDALRSGASGFLLKNAPTEELVHAGSRRRRRRRAAGGR
jgi:CheY-like chemotaxis protein